MDSSRLIVYFDFISPYAYLAWRQLRRHEETRQRLDPRPVVFAGLLAAHGQRAPVEIPAKRRMVAIDCLRTATKLGIPLAFPPSHPFRSIDALRLCLGSVAGERQVDLIDALFAAAWEHGREISNPGVLGAELTRLGLDRDALLAQSQAPATKAALKKATDDAIAAGVFGVPTFQLGETLVWGQDRMDDAIALLHGRLSPIATAAIEGFLKAPPAASDPRRTIAQPAPSNADAGSENDELLARARALFRQAAFVAHLGIGVNRIASGRIETSLTLRSEMLQQHGFVHAGVLATLADHSAGAAAATAMQPGETPMTIEFKINFLRPANGPSLRCISAVLRSGSAFSVVESEVYSHAPNGAEKLVAKATVTLAVVKHATVKPA